MWTKHTYYYNHQTCKYERKKISWKASLWKGSLFLLSSAVISVSLTRYHSTLVTSSNERALQEEVVKLKAFISNFEDQLERCVENQKLIEERDDKLYRAILGMDPLSSTERNAGIGGVDKYENLKQNNSELIVLLQSKMDKLERKLLIQNRSFDRIQETVIKKINDLVSTPAIYPIPKQCARTSCGYGMRLHPIVHTRMKHEGMDFAASIGTPVYATANGYVKSACNDTGYGLHVYIDHGNGYKTLYAHLDSISVNPKQRIFRGQQIGTVGNSGQSTGPHLHYEVRYRGKKVDPKEYFVCNFSPLEYKDIREQSEKYCKTFCANF